MGTGSANLHGSGQVKAAAACGLAPFIAEHGVDADRVLGEAGLTERVFDDPDASIPLYRYVAMMEQAARHTANPMFGLSFGRQFPPAAHGPIGELALAAPSIRAGLQAFIDFFPLHQDNTRTALTGDGRTLRLEYRILEADIWSRRQDAELTIAMFAGLLAHALGPALRVEEVCFEHPAMEAARKYERAFGAPVYFSARTNAITIRDSGLDRPMPQADPRRFMALAGTLRGRSRAAGIDLKTLVCGEIRRLLPEGCPAAETVADSLGLARWTLQRRLAGHGVTFSECVDQVRARLAALYLEEPHLSIGGISDLLGYSEISAFSRACRRWYGTAPAALRKQHLRGWMI